MFPVLLDLGEPWILSTYGVLVALGFVAALLAAVALGRRETAPPLPAEAIVDACVYSLLVGLVGSKLLLLFLDWRLYVEQPRLVLQTLRFAGVFYGGLLLSLLFVAVYCRARRIPLLQMLDVMTPATALGHAFGRAGCFLAGCCWGKPCDLPWAVTFGSAFAHEKTGVPLGIPLHPVQLYEAAINLAIFAFLFFWASRRPGRVRGGIAALYFLLYAGSRFFLEFLRDDPRGWWIEGRVSTSQGIALLLAAGALALGLFLRRRGRRGRP